jgi:gliding motility-associated-like protein
MRLFFIVSFLIISSTNSNAQIIVNEYSAANYDGITDNNGDYEDWFELYNTGGATVDLAGYYLSDKEDNLTKWQIPSSLTINPNQHRVIYASGRNQIVGTSVHTNFKLHQTKDSEYIILTDPDGVTVIDSIFVRPCLTNHSNARITDGSPNWGVQTTPSPEATNVGTFLGYSNTPEPSIAPGIFNNNINVSLSAAPGAQVYYTTDGSLPDNTDNLYAGPININTTTVLKAVAYDADPNILPSFMNYGTYFVNVSHSMKILSVSGNQVGTLLAGTQIQPRGTFELYDSNGNLIDKARGEFNKHGNDSWVYPQRGFDYITRDQFGYNHAIRDELFNGKDRDEFQRLIIKCAANDNYPFSYGGSGAYIRDSYVQSLSQIADLRLDERSFEPCVMYLNGEYWGLYELREKVDDLDFTDYYFDQDSVEFLKTWGLTLVDVLTTDQAEGPVYDSWDNLVNFVTSNDMTDDANYDYVKSVYNVGSLMDYYILNSYIVNADWLNYNTGWWHGLKEDGDKKKWRYILWDMDNTFDHGTNYTGIPSTDPDADPCDAESEGDVGNQGHVPIWNALSQNEEFSDDFINRWSDLSNTYFSCEFMTQHLDSLIDLIEPEMQDQIDRWGGSYAEWSANVDDMKDFMLERCAFINEGLVDCYDIEGPYNVTVEIVGNGGVDLNSIQIDNNNAPWSGEYFSGVDIDFSVTSGIFSYYEIVSADAYVYDPNDSDFSMDIEGDLTVIFYFDPLNVTYQLNPAGSGSIIIDGSLISTFPHSDNYVENTNVTLSAIPNVGWKIENWTSQNNPISPNNTSENVSFACNSDDVITLNLVQTTNEITYMVNPPESEVELYINGSLIDNFPYTKTEVYGENLSLSTQSTLACTFDYWSSNSLISGQPNGLSQNIVATQSDTIVLNYLENKFYPVNFEVTPPGSGRIILNDLAILTPYLEVFAENELIRFEALANDGYEFKDWSSAEGNILPTAENLNGYSVIEGVNTLTANFVELFKVFVPNTFTPNNGDYSHNYFEISVFTPHSYSFEIKIYSRFNELIFESDDVNKSWDGTHYKTSKELPVGAYAYDLEVKSTTSNDVFKKVGTITILR